MLSISLFASLLRKAGSAEEGFSPRRLCIIAYQIIHVFSALRNPALSPSLPATVSSLVLAMLAPG